MSTYVTVWTPSTVHIDERKYYTVYTVATVATVRVYTVCKKVKGGYIALSTQSTRSKIGGQNKKMVFVFFVCMYVGKRDLYFSWQRPTVFFVHIIEHTSYLVSPDKLFFYRSTFLCKDWCVAMSCGATINLDTTRACLRLYQSLRR